MHLLDTIYALSSGRPPAAVSIVRLSGPGAHEAGSRIAGMLPAARVAALRELIDPENGELIDRALVLRFNGPGSVTGEDVVEFHCHGGRAVTDALLAALEKTEGLRQAIPGEFTRRAFEHGRIDLTEAEGLADLIEAETQSQRRAAIRLSDGELRRIVEGWRDRIVVLSAEAELAIDYDEDDMPIDTALAARCHSLALEIADRLVMPRVERLKDGLSVVVAGPPNAGKSSLINEIAGDAKAIVTDVPGTTRDIIEVPLSLNGIPIRLTDTAGVRDTSDPVESLAIEKAQRWIAGADVLVWLGEPESAPPHPRVVAVHSKSDRPDRRLRPKNSIAVSSVLHTGVPQLLGAIEKAARALLPREDQVLLNRRHAVLLDEARVALDAAAVSAESLFLAEELRHARAALDRLTGRAGVEDVLDALFTRFCLGK